MAVWGGGVFAAEKLAHAKALRVGSGYEEIEKQQVGLVDKRCNQRNSQSPLIQSLSTTVEILTFILSEMGSHWRVLSKNDMITHHFLKIASAVVAVLKIRWDEGKVRGLVNN